MSLSASDLQTVYSLLCNSLSLDPASRKPAETALADCENRPGFCSCLLEIIGTRDAACREDARLLASVYFKNSITRHWRNRRGGISNDEKIHLRKKLLLHIREENPQIALQLAVLVSKIARTDYPKEWPELFSFLAQQLQSTDVLASHRVFLVLYRTLKELSSKRLSSDQRIFSEIASHLFDYTWNLWQSDVQTILQNFSAVSQGNSLMEQQNDLLLRCERWFLCSKIIRHLLNSGHPSDSTTAQEVQQVKDVCPMLLNAIQSFLPYYSSFLERQSKFWDFTQRTCTKLMKILVELQGRHPYSFGDKYVLPSVFNFCFDKITNPEPALSSFEQFLIQCMIMLKSILECKEYKPSMTGRVMNEHIESLDQRKKNLSVVIGDIITTVLPNDRVVLLCNILIRRYFIYTMKDLDGWYQNPEAFHHEQDMIQWTEKLRPCAEALYIVLFENYREILGPVIVSILHEATSSSPPSETEISPGMLLKDAAYTAAGHVYYEISSFLSFSDWFNGSLTIELANDHPNMRIIHRKVALLLGQWVSEIKGDTRKQVYCSLIRLLQDGDIAVRLAACRSLCYLLQDSNFCEQDFYEFLPTCWNLCFKLVDDVQEFDSKVQVLNLIAILIEHVGEKISPFASQLLDFFHKIWEDSAGESLLQIQLLEALRNFVCSLGYQSPICYSLLLPILKKGIDVDDADALNLLEDSVLLWEATVSHAPSMVPQLLELFPSLLPIIERGFDHVQVAINIIEDYIIFGGSEFLKLHAPILAKLLDAIVGNVNDKCMLSILPVIDILIECFPMDAPPLISEVLQKLILICLSGEEERNPSKTTVRASSAAILARLLVMNINYLAHLASEPSLSLAIQQAGISLNQNILLCLVDIWLDKIDNATAVQKMTYALALSIILTLRVPEVIDKLEDILSVCTSVILGRSEGTSEEDSSGDATSPSCSNNGSFGYGGIPSKELRRRQIKDSDPIKQLSLEDMVKENLKACASIHGEASFNAAISRIHPSAFAQIQQALKMC